MKCNPISSSLYPYADSSAWFAVGLQDCFGIAEGFRIVLGLVRLVVRNGGRDGKLSMFEGVAGDWVVCSML